MRSTRSKMSATMFDDLDAITPCPPCEPQESTENTDAKYGMTSSSSNFHNSSDSARTSRSASPSADDCASSPFSSTQSSTTPSLSENLSSTDEFGRSQRRRSVKALEDGTNGDPARLWRRMLDLQQRYGCYKSARMSAALSSADASLLLPSKACLDMLNENMTALPDDVELALEHSWGN